MVRFLGATKLTIALCLLLAAAGIAGSFLYQGNTSFGKPSAFNVFRSPFFLVPAGFLVLNILFCVIPRLREMPAGKPRTWSFAGLHLGLLLLAAGLAIDGVAGFVGTQYFPVGAPYSGYHNWRTGRDEALPFTVTVTGSEVRFHPRNLQVGVQDAGGKKVALFVVREGVSFEVPDAGLVVTPRKFDEERKALVLDASVGGTRHAGLTATREAPARVAGYAIVPVAYFNPEPSGYAARIRFDAPGRAPEETTLRINHPASYAGTSFSIVDLRRDPYGNAIVGLQMTREPGASLFWIGALLFGASMVTHLLLKNIARGTVAAVAVALLLSASPAASHAFGVVIDRDAAWEGEMRVTEPVTVEKGAILTIRPGTVVLLSGEDRDRDECADGYLQVFGELRVEGDRDRPVRFAALAPGKPWREIFFKDARAVIRHAVFEGAAWALHIHDGVVRVEDTLLRANGGGARMKGSGATFTRCVISGNGIGLRFWVGGPTVTASAIEGNGTGLFYREGTGGGKINGNRISNREWDVKIGEWASGDLDLSGNYWGASPGAVGRIRDYREHKDVGKVTLSPRLTVPPAGVPVEKSR
ncbi:MAG: right-handed parallel beta-helix repeat-containing protein [bacterium]|jgi:hypothetical protein